MHPHPRSTARRAARHAVAALLLLAACSGQDVATDTEQAASALAASAPAADMSAPAGVASAPAPEASVKRAAPGSAPAVGATQPGDTAPATVAPSSMIIRTGAASVEVRDVDSAMVQVRALAARVGGYVANSSVSGGRNQLRSASLELKIPAARFDEALAGLAPIGTVEHVNVTAEDVGEEYTDLTARVANARRLEARLIELLATRTGRLEDVLAVERELARVREEIERIEGRMRFLRTRVATSTLTVTVHEPAPIAGAPGENPIARAFRQAWANFVGFVALFISSLGVLVPLGVIVLAVWWLVRRFAFRGARRGPRPASEPPQDREAGAL